MLPHPMTPIPSFAFDFACIFDRSSLHGHAFSNPLPWQWIAFEKRYTTF
jgi:hypothetical protein